MEGSLVIYNGELYYVENVQFKYPYIYSKKGGKFVPVDQLTLFRRANTDIEKLINYVYVCTNKIMSTPDALHYIETNISGIHENVKNIYKVVRLPPASTFAVDELVHVGSKRFRVVAINHSTYTLSPNVGGGGGENVDVLKEYVTKDPNLTSTGDRWLASLFEPRESRSPLGSSGESDCRIPETKKELFQNLRSFTTLEKKKFDRSEVATVALSMFGYTPTIFDDYRTTFVEQDRSRILNKPNRDYNIEFFNSKSGMTVDTTSDAFFQAETMKGIFDTVNETGIFTTRSHGIVYRSFAKSISSAKNVCGMSLNRFTSTTVVKNYADKWGQAKDPDTRIRNTEGFFTTIIIPAGTKSIIPLLLFDDLPSKRKQYEVLLSPDGMLQDTGYVDSGGSKIVVYVEQGHCGMPMNEILMMKMEDGTNILEFIKCIFEGNITYVGLTGGKTRRKNRITRKGYQKNVSSPRTLRRIR
jgi:hypothetical protein